jgi:hypothetical protein
VVHILRGDAYMCERVCAIEVSVPSQSVRYIGWVAMGESLFICVTHLSARDCAAIVTAVTERSRVTLLHPSAARKKVTHTPHI